MTISEKTRALQDDRSCQATVAICTYNRPNMLRGVLDALEHQEEVDAVIWEILVVDNDPASSARTTCDSYASTSRCNMRYIHEQKAGLSHARNRAISESLGAIIAFLDDDVLLPRRWLLEMLRTFQQTDADCVGGRVLVEWEGHPDDVVKNCEKELVAYDKGERDILLVRRDVPIGANLAFKANVLDSQRLFVVGLGRTRTNLMGCEEIELLLRLRKQNRRIWYSAASVVMHRTGGERLTGQYYLRREYWNGVSQAAVDKLHSGWLYCQFKGWLRLGQVMVTLLPLWLGTRAERKSGMKFLSACHRRKYMGYWLGVMGFAQKPQ
jgi:glycosyltransferase involved in cell wall biosynthesis